MQKSRPWAAMVAVVVLAALVVLSGCQGAVGKTGPAGPAGESGTTGTTGTPGTTDNMSPVATAIPTVYLALNGTAAPAVPDKVTVATDVEASTTGYKVKTVDLTKSFSDTESPTQLSYTAVSTNPKIATVTVDKTTLAVASGKLKITGVAAGDTTIIATAFDGVNAGVPTTINVIVVAHNSPPTASVTSPVLDLTDKLKLVSDSAQEVAFMATINTGTSGEPTEAITFRTVAGDGLTATVKLVSGVTTRVSGNSYILTVKRLKPGTNDVSAMQKLTIFAMDSFGAETMVDINGADLTGTFGTVDAAPEMHLEKSSLVVEVNAPPRLALALPDVTLYRSLGNVVAGDAAVPGGPKSASTEYDIADFFAVEYAVDANDPVPARVRDTTCVVTTSPKQPTGEAPAAATTADPPVAASAGDPVKATTLASVVGGYAAGDTGNTELDTVTVDAAATTELLPVNGADVTAAAAGLGSFTLTITCTDTEKSAIGTATITVRPGVAP